MCFRLIREIMFIFESQKKDNMSQSKTSKIRFTIKLNEENIPTDIQWIATDSEHGEAKRCKSFMINMWDRDEPQTLTLNLWTNDMQMDEMYVHFYQSLMEMATSLQRSTGNSFAVEEMKAFCETFDIKAKEELAEKKGNEGGV